MSFSRKFPLAYLLVATALAPAVISGCSCGDDPDDPPVTPAPKITTFSASQTSVEAGATVVLTWKVENATEVTILATPGGTLVDKSDDLDGTVTSMPINANTAFTLTAKGAGGQATRTVNVTLTQVGEVAIDEFDASPATVEPGGSATITFRTTNATRVIIAEVDGAELWNSTTELSGALTVTPTVTTSYVLTAEGPGGPKTAMTSVMVEGTPVIVSFTANPQMIELGAASTLSWNVTNATMIVIEDSAGNEVTSSTNGTGTFDVSPTQNETYTLTASRGGQTVTQSVMVTVNRAAIIVSFTANPSTVDYGDSSELRWEVQRATGVEISANGMVITATTALTGALTVTATTTTEYTLRAINPDGDSTAMVTLTVNAVAPRIRDFAAAPNPALIGTTSVLSWDVIGATNVRIEDDEQNVVIDTADNAGNVTVDVLEASVTYTLIATNPNGSNTMTVVLVGQNLPEIDTFIVEPRTYTGTSTTIVVTYSTSDATGTALFANDVAVPGFPTTSTAGMFTFTATGTVLVRLDAVNAVGMDSAEIRVLNLLEALETGNTATTALALAGDGTGATGEIFPAGGAAGDLDYFSFTVPQDGNVWIQTSDGRGGCPFDTFLHLYGPDGTTQLGTDDDDGFGACSEIDPVRDAFAANLAAGTYYVAVRGFNAAAIGRYVVLVQVEGPACGNQIWERGPGEQCDDGNTASGDGCSATCQIEPAGTVTGPGVNQVFTGSINPVGMADYYMIVMQGEGYIRAETFVSTAGRCDTGGGSPSSDTQVALLDSMLNVVGSDDDDGIGACSRIDPQFDGFARVPAGTYFLRVNEAGNNALISAYVLDVRTVGVGCGNGIIETGETCDDANATNGDGCSALCQFEGGAEVEPNDVFGSATPIPGTQAIFAGSIAPEDDVDFYAITVPEGGHIDVQITVNSLDACPVDPEGRLQLIGTNGTTVLTTNTTGGADGNCGRIWPYTSATARDMAAGTYYIRVNETGDNAEIPLYFLHVNVYAPGCGNTILEGDEQCEDDNVVSGDGCSATCTFEPVVTVNMPSPGTTTVAGSIDPSYNRDAVLLNVTAESYLYAETFVDAATQSCPTIDTALVLLAPDGSFLGEDDFDGVGSCSLIRPTDAFARLAPGMYTLFVEEDGNNTTISQYELVIRSIPVDVCGNTVREVAQGELCDDGNTVGGDGCSATCQIEPAGMQVGAGTMLFTGSINPPGEQDFYRIEVAVPSLIRAETGAPTLGTCPTDDTLIRLWNADITTQIISDDDDGVGACSVFDGVTETGARVEPGVYWLSVEDFSNDEVITQYQLELQIAPLNACGNRLVESANGEFCDDGNTVGGDGCSATCTLDPTFTFAAAPGATQVFAGSITPATETDVVEITVTTPIYLRAETFAPAVGSCAGGVDSFLRLFASDATQLGTDDLDGINSCSLIARDRDEFARLTAGTYYLTVEEDGRNATIGAYELQLTATAADVCGDAIVESAAGETCDDGNTAAGDGCSATCQLEIQATFTAPGAPVVVNDSIMPATNVDAYQINVTTEAYLRIELFSANYPLCATVDPFIRLINATTGAVIGTDDFDGRSSCSLIDPNVDAFARVPAGTYYLTVEEDGRNATIANYELRIWSAAVDVCGNGFLEPTVGAEQCDDGNTVAGDGCSATCQLDAPIPETEPNDAIGTATPSTLNGVGIRTMSGNVTPAGDLDFFAFEVPAGSTGVTLRARLYSMQGNPLSTCDATVDTRMILYNAAGTELENNDDIAGAANRCSFVDGTRPDTDPNARNLAPGTYYLRVSHWSTTTPEPAGPYFLQIQLIQE